MQPILATPIPKNQLSIKSLGLKHYKYYGLPEKCIILLVHNRGTKAVSFPVDNLKNNFVSEPFYTYEIKASTSKDWVPAAIEIGTYQAPAIFRAIQSRKSVKLCVYYPDWPTGSPALESGSSIRLQIKDSVGQSHITQTFSSTGQSQH